jgi:hypothetical protein
VGRIVDISFELTFTSLRAVGNWRRHGDLWVRDEDGYELPYIGGGLGFSDTVEQSLLNHFLTDPAYTPPATMFFGVSTTTPTDVVGNFTEPVGGSYARVSTAAADWAAASGTAPATKATSTAKTFPAATGSWGTLTHAGLNDASSAGNWLATGALGTSKVINSGDTLNIPSGSAVLKLGDPGDTY